LASPVGETGDPETRRKAVVHSDTDSLFEILRQWRAAGKTAALATVVSTWGSSPRPEGSHLAVEESGHFVGSVSGGCIEAAVIEVATQVMASGEPQTLEFGISDEQAWQVGLACGGRVKVFVEPVE
jgi:xanthine/CO dehydrogenase XdhC/CoxF family maturation factor